MRYLVTTGSLGTPEDNRFVEVDSRGGYLITDVISLQEICRQMANATGKVAWAQPEPKDSWSPLVRDIEKAVFQASPSVKG